MIIIMMMIMSVRQRRILHVAVSDRDQIEVFNILNGYADIDRYIYSHLRNIVELEVTKKH